MLIIDTSTGTVLTASTCVLVPDAALTEAEWEALDTMTDSEVGDLARERGAPVLQASAWQDRQALDAISRLLDGQEWNSDTTAAIAELIVDTGRTIA